MSKQISDGSFESEVINASKPVLVDFWAPWCGPCRMMTPILDQVEENLSGKMKIVKIDTDDNPVSAGQYQITGIPCIILFKHGKEMTRIVGVRSANALETEIKKYL